MPPPRPLRSLDLFSGVGGITHALKGFAEPLAYCDNSGEAQAVLTKLMQRGSLPPAPICPDVSKLNRKWIRKNCESSRVDMIVAGFPCVGFSSLGLHSGFENVQSGLFLHVLRLVDETDCQAVFLENVPNVLKIGMHDILEELYRKRGFELRWCVTPASHVGSQQLRKRWFCLGMRAGFRYVHAPPPPSQKYRMYPWGTMPEPARMVLKYDSAMLSRRLELLGNSVIPDAVRFSFLYLASGFSFDRRLRTLDLPKGFVIEMHKKDKGKGKRPHIDLPPAFSRTGLVTVDGNYTPLPGFSGEEPWRRVPWKQPLVFDPAAYVSDKPPGALLIEDSILTRPITKKLWGTPRRSCIGAGNFLTKRLSDDLPTQIRFEVGTNDRLRSGRVSVEFVEYLMGFPLGWTDFSTTGLRQRGCAPVRRDQTTDQTR